MCSFPVELLVQIFRDTRQRDLLDLSKTCKRFHSIAQAQLYKDVTLEWMKGKAQIDGADILFARSLSDTPALGGIVQTLRYEPKYEELEHKCSDDEEQDKRLREEELEYDEDGDKDEEDTVEDLISTSPVLQEISLFSNLRRLELSSIRIDIEFCVAIQPLPFLHTVIYNGCEVSERLAAAQDSEQIIWGGSLLSVAISSPASGIGWTTLIPSTLRTFKLLGFLNRDLTEQISIYLMLRSRSYELTTLTFNWSLPENIVDLLICCPLLKRIHLPICIHSPEESLGLWKLPTQALPLLEDFCGDVIYADVLVSRRPVHRASIFSFIDHPKRSLLCLSRSETPVTHLVIDAQLTSLEFLRDAPPTLRYLHMKRSQELRETLWLSALPKFPDLLVLHLSGLSVSPTKQAKLVKVASGIYRSLQEFIFEEHAYRDVYQKRWRRKAGTWECYYDQGLRGGDYWYYQSKLGQRRSPSIGALPSEH